MSELIKITEAVYRLTIPFFDVYTTVFLIKTPQGAALYDTATYPEDVDQYIIPALKKLKISPEILKYIVISHNHRDHSGGLERLMEEYPGTCVVACSKALQEKYSNYRFLAPDNGTILLDTFRVLNIPGHSADCIGLLEESTGTLLSGDCLQMYGLFGSGKWGTNISMPLEYLDAIDRLRALQLKMVVASHAYHPHGYIARGDEKIGQFLDTCVEALYVIKQKIQENPECTDETLAEKYNSSGEFPTVGAHVFAAIRKYMC